MFTKKEKNGNHVEASFKPENLMGLASCLHMEIFKMN